MVIITVVHVIVCFALILIVLLQAGKGAEMEQRLEGRVKPSLEVPERWLSHQIDHHRCGCLHDHLVASGVRFIQRTSSVIKGGPAQTAPAQTQPVPVQPQVPAPEPKK